MTTIEIKDDFVIKVRISSEMMARLAAHDQEALKSLSNEIQSAILAAVSHTRPVRREETR